jgi:hypothetical protein
MILQPSLVVVLGKQWQELPPRIKRWFEPKAQGAVEFLTVEPNGDFSAGISAAVNRLRSGEMLAELTRNQYVPRSWNLDQLRVLVVCDASETEGLRAVREAVDRSLREQAFGTVITPSYWVLTIGPESIEEIPIVDTNLQSVFSTAEGSIIFHILSFWRASRLPPAMLCAIAERLIVHLLKMDMSPDKRLVGLLSPANKRPWLVGLEGHLLQEVDDTVRTAISAALLRSIRGYFRGDSRSPLILKRVLLETIPSYESDAALDPDSEVGISSLRRYRAKHLPALLEKLAPYAESPSDMLDLLGELDAQTCRKNAPPAAAAALLIAADTNLFHSPVTWVVLVILLIIAAFVIWLVRRPKIPPPPPVQPFPSNEIFTRALREVMASISDWEHIDSQRAATSLRIRYPLERPIPATETPVITDSVTRSEVTEEMISHAEQLIVESKLTFSQLLSAHWLQGDLAPTKSADMQIFAQWHEKLRGDVILRWLGESRAFHASVSPTDYGQFLFAPKPPQQGFTVFELADASKALQASVWFHPGWYPANWLHYLYLVSA